jgi:POT family proton-dependent oligopeptide transporter
MNPQNENPGTASSVSTEAPTRTVSKHGYLTAPLKTDKMPPGIPFIVGNEAAERFSYYGMNSILVIFMTSYLMNAQGKADHMSDAQAEQWYHTFVSAVYYLPVVGAILADAVFGKYRVIFWLSIVYCFGHFALALNDTRIGLMLGCSLIALGAGGIKPCVSANVGDQFGATNQHLLPRVFSWFYFSINLGSAISTILIPELLNRVGPRWAFGMPGIAMLIATIVFWSGRKKFVHIPPAGPTRYFEQFSQPENLKALANLLILVPFAAMFWALWQQNFSSWVLQANHMDRHMFGYNWLPAEIQTVNPVFVLLMLPFTSYVLYPALNKIFAVTPLRKFGMGLFAVIVAFLIVGWIQTRIDAGQTPHILWQILAFLVLTFGEVLVSVTHLEFAYTQAPRSMKSLVMCTYLGSVALGNTFTALVNKFIQNPDGSVKLQGASYFFFFVKVMLVTAIIFVFVSRFYRGRTYIQEEQGAEPA